MRLTIAALCAVVANAGFVNPGTPPGISNAYDCKVRKFAWEYGKELLPQRGDFKSLFEAMQLEACNMTTPTEDDVWKPPSLPTPSGNVIFVDASKGSNSAAGTLTAPVASIAKAVSLAKAGSTILLRAGTYFTDTINIGPELNGLTIQNYNGEAATISGGVPLKISKADWKPYKIKPAGDLQITQNFNNVYGKATDKGDTNTIKYLGSFQTLDGCESAFKTSPKGPFKSFTWHGPNSLTGDYKTQCFGVTNDEWSGQTELGVVSGRIAAAMNVWEADLSATSIAEIAGLRIGGERSIRAKYPNGNMELSGNWLQGAGASMGGGQYVKGWVTDKTQWVPPFRHPDAQEVVVNDADWPGVEWPHYTGSQSGEGDKGDFHIGIGGYCQDDLQDPLTGPSGYWCAMAPPRGQCWDKKSNQGKGCTQTHMSPDGVVWERAQNYSDPSTAVVLSWRGGGRWFSQMSKVSHFVKENSTLIFDPTTGGQGGEGMTDASQWWIENVLEECDSANEFFFDEKSKTLYYAFNGTAPPTGDEELVATQTRVLFNITGTKDKPVTGVKISGFTLRDTRLTYLDPHGMPSGGDWALQRSGAIFLQGTEKCTVDNNLMIRLDGNAVFLSAYNRNTTISNNEVAWNGDSAFAGWGITGKCLNEKCDKTIDWPVGPDGRAGEQPRFTSITGNLVREIGIWQKQSSMWFQAVVAQTYFAGNVHFNGPRAGINFNDGFGGANVIERNLLTNCVRESGDHGPFNSWDRVPYITEIATPGKPSIVPAWNHIRNNFIMSLYSSQEAIDNDDGSAYYKTYDNYFVYAANGLKSDFNGHDNRHYRNVYAFVGNCWGSGQSNWFVNNSCVTNSADGGFRSDCQDVVKISGNEIYTTTGTLKQTKICDTSNKVVKTPSDDDIIEMGKKVLNTKWVGVEGPAELLY